MKKTPLFLAVLTSTSTVLPWAGGEASTPVEKKQTVNFHGVLKTQQGNTHKVDNISINGKFRQIPMFELPSKDRKAGAEEIKLSVDPKTELITTNIDLSETSEIGVPHPHQVWSFSKGNGKRKVNYIEVVIISNDQSKTKNHYLLELRSKVFCHGISAAGPLENKVPLQAIKTLSIQGHYTRQQNNNDNSKPKKKGAGENSACACPCVSEK